MRDTTGSDIVIDSKRCRHYCRGHAVTAARIATVAVAAAVAPDEKREASPDGGNGQGA